MSTVRANQIQIGQSATVTDNGTWYQPTGGDGTIRYAVGPSTSKQFDALTINGSGKIDVARSLTVTQNALVSGNVGIGTSSPSYKLNVKSSSGEYRTALFETSSTLGPSVQIKGSRIHELRSTDSGATEGAGYFLIYDKTAEASRITIDSSGRVTMPAQPNAAGGCSTAYTLSSAGFINGFDIVWNSVDKNVGSHYNSSNGKFTAPVAGAYLVMYMILIPAAASTANDYRLSLSINDAQTMTGSVTKGNGYPQVVIQQVVYLNANDTVKARFWNDSGVGSTHADANYQRFSIRLLG